MAFTRCKPCKGQGTRQIDGKGVGNGQPYTLVCAHCNGVGHFRDYSAEWSERAQ